MYRKDSIIIEEWLKRSDKALLVTGARQIGKTWLIREEIAKSGYCKFEVNFIDQPDLVDYLNVKMSANEFLVKLKMIMPEDCKPQETVVFFDEIQKCPEIVTKIKFLVEEGSFKYVMSGSLLGVELKGITSVPVGYLTVLRMYPMDFEEFLMAAGETDLCDLLRQPDWEILKILSLKYVDLLRQYCYVGGMPEVVDCFFQHQNLQEVRDKQTEILDAYRRDISKHTTPTESIRIGQVLQSLPSQLAKENKKFIYNVLKKGARATEYELAIQWLMDAGLVHKVSRIKELQMPVKFYEDLGAFKLFLLDCGLLGCMTEAPASQMLVGDNVFKEFKGAFTEQFVLQQLVAQGFSPYYWSSDKTPAEIDFVVQTEHRVIPVEVKAEENVRARSMSEYIKNHPDYQLKGLRVSMMGYQDQEWMENIPLFAITKFFG